MRRIVIVIVLVVLAIAGYFGYQSVQARQTAAQTQFQTERVASGDITALVGATGTVRSNQTAILSWQTTGQVEDVYVEVGDKVTADEELASLLESSLPQNIILAQTELYEAQRTLEDLQDDELSLAQAQVRLTEAIDALEEANKKRTSKDYRRSDDETLETARANYLLAENNVEKTQEIFDIFKDRPEDDIDRLNALSALMAARQERDRSLANYNYLQSSPDSNEVAQADANVILAEAQLQVAQKEYDRLKDGADPDQIAAAEARVAAAEATLGMAQIKAPFAGTVTEVNSMPGDQVAPGVQAFRLDDLSHLLVDVQVPEVDINRVEVGQSAQITFDAVLTKEYQARVVKVAQVGNTLEGAVNFTITLELENPDQSIRPGMTAAVNIVISQLEDVLIIPNRAVRLRNGQPTVYLLKNGQAVPVEVEVGASSESFSEVVSGDVREGDTIILNPPQFEPGSNPFMR